MPEPTEAQPLTEGEGQDALSKTGVVGEGDVVVSRFKMRRDGRAV